MNKRVVVAMSGGVDSSIAAYLLKEQGFEVIGLFMSLGTCLERLAPKRKACCSVFDAHDAQRVADMLGIKFSVLNFKQEFEQIINYFCSEYDSGRTPNPCIRCNQHLKFGKLLEYVDKLGADYIATGHYARIENKILATKTPRHQVTKKLKNGRTPFYFLKKGVDVTKDQSYVLFTLTQPQLARIIFPLGELTKPEVRKIAHKINLPVKDKPESQDICFVSSSGYQNLLKERLPHRLKEGKVKDTHGRIIGRHDGYQLYTIGQRHGLKIALGKPAYVCKIMPKTNTVVLGDRADVYKTTFLVDEVNWISLNSERQTKLEAEVKIRYLHKQAKAKISILNDRRVKVKFHQPQLAITPGQAAVFYKKDTVLGGGWIRKTIE